MARQPGRENVSNLRIFWEYNLNLMKSTVRWIGLWYCSRLLIRYLRLRKSAKTTVAKMWLLQPVTLFGVSPGQQTQHFKVAYRNITGYIMLLAHGHPAATICDMFGCSLFCRCCMMLWPFGQIQATMLSPSMGTSSILNTQHATARRKREAKGTQHVAPNNVWISCV